MGRLRIAAAEYNYREIDRQLREQFIHGLNDDNMLIEIICELTAIKDTTVVTSKQVVDLKAKEHKLQYKTA